MADNRYENPERSGQPMKKADLIIKRQSEAAVKIEELLNQAKASNASLETVLEKLDKQAQDASGESEQIKTAVNDAYASLKQELRYLAAQNESIYDSVADKVKELEDVVDKINKQETPVAEEKEKAEEPAAREPEIDYDLLADKVAQRIPAQQAVTDGAPVQNELDYDLLADKVAQRMPAPQVVTDGVAVQSEPLDYDLLVDKLIARMPQQEVAVTSVTEPEPVIDYDVLAEKVAQHLPERESAQPAEIDYEALAEKVAQHMPRQEVAVASAGAFPVVTEQQIDYDLLADKVASRIPVTETHAETVAPVPDLDMDFLADKVVSRIPVQEAVSPDYIASRVAEQLVMPRASAEVDLDALAEKVAEKLEIPQPTAEVDPEVIAQKVIEKLEVPQANVQVDNDYIAEKVLERINASTATGNVDCDYIASKVAEQIVIPEPQESNFDYDYLAHKVAEQIVIPEVEHNSAVFASAGASSEINEEELADAIALKVGTIKPEDFDILVDDDGCASISAEIAKKLDYDLISATVAEKLREALVDEDNEEIDYDEMAQRISEKINFTGVSEDAIADKAAAILSNYLPEIDSDEIADKVAEQVISALPAAVDGNAITESISARLIESQQESDYQVVLDDEGIEKVSDGIYKTEEVRFDDIDRELSEIKELLNGKVVLREEVASASAYEVADDSLVTVSEIIETYEPAEETVEENPAEEEVIEEPAEEPVEEVTEEVTEEAPVEEVAEEEVTEEPAEEVAEVVEEAPVEEIAEEPEETEEEPEDNDDESDDAEVDYDEQNPNGVDFANMMRYNRSFIARIIQSSDEQKKYYGEVRSALLSYRKVNSNIAWGAERFHKGRETIARFKIRGKTLVLYLALDPATHEYTVYHHKDVSDNKSLHGTPMMVKIKSPLGVKKAIRLVDEMLEARNGEKRNVPERDYAAMYPYESIEELIEDGLVKDVKKK